MKSTPIPRFVAVAGVLCLLSVGVMRMQTTRDRQTADLELPHLPAGTPRPIRRLGEVLQGRVLDQGRPVAGAQVLWMVRRSSGPVIEATAITDREGRFVIPDARRLDDVGLGALVVRRAGRVFAFAERRVWGDGTNVTIDRPAPVRLRVPFRDSGNAPLANLAVQVSIEAPEVGWVDLDTDRRPNRTDRNGLLLIPGLPAETFVRIQVADTNIAPLPTLTRIALRSDTTRDVPRTRVYRAATLRGRLLSPAGHGVGGRRIEVYRVAEFLVAHRTVTAPDGGFVVSGISPGVYVVAAEGGGDAQGPLACIPVRNLPVREGEQRTLPPLQLVRAATIVGRARDASSGQALPGVRVYAVAGAPTEGPLTASNPRFLIEGDALDDGTFELHVPPGRMQVGGSYLGASAFMARSRLIASPSDITLTAGQRVTVTLLYGQMEDLRTIVPAQR